MTATRHIASAAYSSMAEANKKLGCRKETVRLLCGAVVAKYNLKTIFVGTIDLSSTTVTYLVSKAVEFGKITQNKGYCAV